MLMFKPQAIKSTMLYIMYTFILTFMLFENNSIDLSLLSTWLCCVNLVLFCIMGKDKFSAKLNISRVPEGTLLWLAFFGGFAGLFLGRFVFKHKTTKTEFIIPMWLLLILQIVLFCTLNYNVVN